MRRNWSYKSNGVFYKFPTKKAMVENSCKLMLSEDEEDRRRARLIREGLYAGEDFIDTDMKDRRRSR